MNSQEPVCKAQLCLLFSNNSVHATLLTSRENKVSDQPSLGQIPTVESGWTNLFLPSLSERNRSHKWGVSLPSCASLLRVGYVQMNTYSVCMKEKKYPTSSESPGESIDDEKEESPRLGLPSSSFILDSSALMAHMDMAPHTKGRSNHVQTSAESPAETGTRREK